MKETKQYFTTSEAAKILGVSRITVFRYIKSGKIKAERIGKAYIISKDNLVASFLNDEEKVRVQDAVKKAIADYSEVFKKLGRE